MLKLVNLNFSYMDKKILNSINMVVPKGKLIALTGANGTGKSTLLHAINDFEKYRNCITGKILIDEKDIENNVKYRSDILMIGQDLKDTLFYDFTVNENIQMYYQKKIDMPDSIIQKKYNLNYQEIAGQKVQYLSGGQKQSLALLLVSLINPKLLLLDEHTSALDPSASIRIMELTKYIVKHKGVTAIMVTHNLSFANLFADTVYELQNGSLYLN